MGAFSILPNSNHHYRLQNGVVERWTNGVDFLRNMFASVPLLAVTDSFIGGNAGDEYLYGYQASSGYWRQQKDSPDSLVVTESDYNTARSAAGSIILDGSAGATPTPPASTIPVTTIEANLDLTGHQIKNLGAGVDQTDGVNVSQLEALIATVVNQLVAGDDLNAGDIANLANVVANLPQGLTMAQVEAAIVTKVGEAVFAEELDDAQKQALVDAALAQLSTIDTAILGRMTGAEGTIADNQQRLSGLEAHDLIQDANIGALQYVNGVQDANIAATANTVSSLGSTVLAHAERISQAEIRDTMFTQVTTPIEVSVVNGAVVDAIGVSLAAVSIDNSNDTHIQVTINLGTDTNGQKRVAQAFRVMPNGTERDLGAAQSRNGEAYIFAFLKTCQGSSSTKFYLN